jgi:Asp/Glu/hydantoin racemase
MRPAEQSGSNRQKESRIMKVGLIYTGNTPELTELVEGEVKKQLGSSVEMFSLEDASILAETRDAGYVTANAAARLVTMFMKAVQEGCDAILNICSSVGETADSVQDLADYIGVPIVRIDEEMCREAVRKGTRIGVMATLETTLEPTKNTIRRMSRACGRPVEIVDCLVENAFGLDQDAFRARMTESAEKIADQVDVIVFAQGSMAYCEQYIADKVHKTVLSSPRFGAAALRRALEDKGTL